MSAVKLEDNIMINLLDKLIREEKKGCNYFREAGKFAQDTEIKRVFEWLSEEESNHTDILCKLRSRLILDGQSRSRPKRTIVDGQIVNIVDLSDMTMEKIDLPEIDLFKNEAFVDLFKKISPRSVIQYAMTIEFENANYIKSFFELVQAKAYREILVKLIEDEKQHFLILQKQLKKM